MLDKLFWSSQVSAVDSLSPRRSLYRTLSDESVSSNRKGSSYASSHSSMLDQAMPNDILFSTTPPYHSTLPPRMIHNQGASNLRSKYTNETLDGPARWKNTQTEDRKANTHFCQWRCWIINPLLWHRIRARISRLVQRATWVLADIISTTGTHSSSTPQYSHLIGNGWGCSLLARDLPLRLH